MTRQMRQSSVVSIQFLGVGKKRFTHPFLIAIICEKSFFYHIFL